MAKKKKEKCTKCNGSGIVCSDPCPQCNGTGTDPKKPGVRCWMCMGWGIIKIHFLTRCENCNGKGFRDWVDNIRRPV